MEPFSPTEGRPLTCRGLSTPTPHVCSKWRQFLWYKPHLLSVEPSHSSTGPQCCREYYRPVSRSTGISEGLSGLFSFFSFRRSLERYDSPAAVIRVPIHCANETPGTKPITSFMSQMSRWCVTRPCSLKDRRVTIRSVKCRGEGKDNEVPGIGSEGDRKGCAWGAPSGEP